MMRFTKRVAAMLLAMCVLMPCALAEGEGTEPIRESIGSWVDKTIADVMEWGTKTWDDLAEQAGTAAEEASKWAQEALDETGKAVTGLWGRFTDWASEAYGSASDQIGAWWGETLDAAKDTALNAWEWIREKAKTLKEEFCALLRKIRDALTAEEEEEEQQIRDAFDSMMDRLVPDGEEAQQVWNEVKAYGERKEIGYLTAEKLALPYLFRLAVDREGEAADMTAEGIAQYLTDSLDGLGIGSADDADRLVLQLGEALQSI